MNPRASVLTSMVVVLAGCGGTAPPGAPWNGATVGGEDSGGQASSNTGSTSLSSSSGSNGTSATSSSSSSSGGGSSASSSSGSSASGSSGAGSSSGSSSSSSGGSSSSGASADAGPVVVPPPRMTPDAFTGAPAYVAKTGNSAHNPGKSCIASGCHATSGGGEAPAFLIGGTVYKDYAGTIPAPGVEIRVLDSKGNAVSTYSGTNGNFYVNASSSVAFPAMVGARDAMTTRPMVTTLTGTMGSCGQGGCHIVGGSPSTSAYYPIHVP